MNYAEGIALTNNLGLPEPIVKAVMNDHYSGGKSDFTATSLLQPPRARALIKANRDEITEDVSDRIWALCGQIGHTILERAGDPNIVERRFFAKVATFTVSAQADLIISGDTAELVDYKFCSIWTVKEGIKPEWTAQANIIRFLASEDENPITINKANIIAIFRDWSKPKAQREKDYPQTQVQVLRVELWPLKKTENFICERIAAHLGAKDFLPLCTDEERWKDPPKWAVIKKGNKRAHRVLDDEIQATRMAALEHMDVQFRPGTPKRCQSYCLAAPFCSQFQDEQKENGQ